MPIIISADHFDAAKHQAYAIRDGLIQSSISEGLSVLLKKSYFLNAWATVLGYKDWGTFRAKTLHGHQGNKNNTIISPDTLVDLASLLRERCYIGQGETWLFEYILFSCAYPHEKDRFDEEEIAHYNIVPGSKSHPIVLELGPDKYNRHIVNYFFLHCYCAKLTEDDIEERLLAYFKNKRDNLEDKSRDVVKLCYYDVFPKSGKRVNDVIEDAINDNWLVCKTTYKYAKPKKQYSISDRAINYIYMSMTSDYCEDWVLWNKAVDDHIKASPNEYRIEPEHRRVKAYQDDINPVDYANNYLAPALNNQNAPCIGYIYQDIKNYSPGTPVFHLLPYLILPPGHHTKYDLNHSSVIAWVSYCKDGKVIKEKEEHVFSSFERPYRNKCHVLAKGIHDHYGQYLDVSQFDTVVITYKWKLMLKQPIGEQQKVNLDHEVMHYLSSDNKNTLYSAHGRGGTITNPYSFIHLSQVTGCASTKEEMQTAERCQNQLYYFTAEPEKHLVSIKEYVYVNTVPLVNYRY
tara:strand:- start:1789 stop:3339 length:1551 start_codon:yes stop_codon:yes gene_type:complete